MAFRDGKQSCLLCDETPSGGSGGPFDLLAEAERSGHKQLTYAGGLVNSVLIYSDAGFATLLYTKSFTYSAGLVSQLDVVRASDSFAFGKTFTYDMSETLIEVHTF